MFFAISTITKHDVVDAFLDAYASQIEALWCNKKIGHRE